MDKRYSTGEVSAVGRLFNWEGKVCEGKGKLGVGIEKMGMKQLRLLSCITRESPGNSLV